MDDLQAVVGDAVRVAVRVRPLSDKEVLEQCRPCLRVFARERQVVLGKDRGFTFDYVFGERSEQSELYNESCAALVDGCLAGYNGTIMAYGQTGSGKTFTMGSGAAPRSSNDADSAPPPADSAPIGVIPRALRQLFAALGGDDGARGARDSFDESDEEEAPFRVDATYLEIYNEEVKDLLHPHTPARAISIREAPGGEITVAGARAERVRGLADALRLLDAGSAARTTGATLMNAASSRSHSLLTLNLTRRVVVPAAGGDGDGGGARARPETVRAKLHLIDLAGSERNKKTGATGERFKESVTINQGLLALGNVISALGDERRRRGAHVPYRESRLTRLLQDSLGGNSRTLMLACVSPADANFDETLNTLRYANRARNIKNTPVINVAEPDADASAGAERLGELMSEIQSLQQQLHDARSSEAPALLRAPREPAAARAPLGELARRVHALLEGKSDADADADAEGGPNGARAGVLSASAQDGALLALLRAHEADARGDDAVDAAADAGEAEAAADEAEAAMRAAADSIALVGLHREHLLLLLKPLWDAAAAGHAAAVAASVTSSPMPAPDERASASERTTPARPRALGGGPTDAWPLPAAPSTASTPSGAHAPHTPPRSAPSSQQQQALAATIPPHRLRRDVTAVARQAQSAEEAARAALERALAWADAARAARRRVALARGGGVDSAAGGVAGGARLSRRQRRAARAARADDGEHDGDGAHGARSTADEDSRPQTAELADEAADGATRASALGAPAAPHRALVAAERRAAELADALASARADLRRDEEIFADRAAELVALRRDNNELRAALAASSAHALAAPDGAGGERGGGASAAAACATPDSSPAKRARGAASLLARAAMAAWGEAPSPPIPIGTSPLPPPPPPPARRFSSVTSEPADAVGAASQLHGAAWRLAEALEADDLVQLGDGVSGSPAVGRGAYRAPRADAGDAAGATASADADTDADTARGALGALQRSVAAVAEERRLLVAEQRELERAQLGGSDAHVGARAADGAGRTRGADGVAADGATEGGGVLAAQLADSIKAKEQTIRELMRQEREARAALTEAEARSAELGAELDRLRADLDAAHRHAEGGGSAAEDLRAEYADKLAQSEAQVLALRERQRAHSTLAKDKAIAERRLRETAAELGAVRAQFEGLKRRADAAASAAARRGSLAVEPPAAGTSAREVAELRKRVQLRERRIRELEADNARALRQLAGAATDADGGAGAGSARATRAAPAACNGAGARARTPSGGARSRAPMPSAPVTPRRTSSASAAASAGAGGATRPSTSPDAARTRLALDATIDELVRAGQASAQLTVEEAKRADAVRQREGALLARERLRARARESGASAEAEFDATATALARAEAELARARSRARAGDADGDELARVQAEHAAAADARARAEAVLAAHSERTAFELRGIDETIDSYDAALEWHDETLAQLRAGATATSDSEATLQLEQVVDAAALPDSKALLLAYLPQLVDARRALAARERERERLGAQLAESAGQLREQAASLDLAEREFARTLAKQQHAHDLEKGALMRQLRPTHPSSATAASAASPAHEPRSSGRAGAKHADTPAGDAQLQRALRERDEQLQALERDNFYFKQAARELRRQLKETTGGGSAGANALGGGNGGGGNGANAGAADAIPGRARPQTADAERARLERENQQLSNELANLKDYLLKNPSAQMVRVSKRDHVALSGAGGPPRDSTGNAHNVHAGR